MKFVTTPAAVLFLAAAAAHAADHLEAPAIAIDNRADINDVYVFQSSGEPDKVYIVTTVEPLTPGTGVDIVLQRFDMTDTDPIVNNEGFDDPFFFDLPSLNDTTSTADAREPRVAANALGNILISYVNFPPFDPGGPSPITPVARLFDEDGDPLSDPTLLNPGDVNFPIVPDITRDQSTPSNPDFTVGAYNSTNSRFELINIDGTDGESTGTNQALNVPAPPTVRRYAIHQTNSTDYIAAGPENCTPGFPEGCNFVVSEVDTSDASAITRTIQSSNPFTTSSFGFNDLDSNADRFGFTTTEFPPVERTAVAYESADEMFNTQSDLVLLDENGRTVLGPFRLGDPAGLDAASPDVAVNTRGDTFVTYHARNPDTFDEDIYVERFAANGARQGGIVQVNAITAGRQANPTIEALSNGAAAIAFTSNTAGGFTGDIYANVLEPPANVDPDTFVLGEDFGLPWTPITLNTTVTADGGAPDANNFAEIVADPNDPATALGEGINGVLHIVSTDKPIEVAANYNSPFPDIVDLTDDSAPRAMTLEIIMFGDDDAVASETTLSVTVFVDIPSGPGTFDRFDALEFVFDSLTAVDEWTPMTATVPFDPASEPLMDLLFEDGARVNYSVIVTSGVTGDPTSALLDGTNEIWIDDLRFNLVVVPEPSTVPALTIVGLIGARRRRRTADRGSRQG